MVMAAASNGSPLAVGLVWKCSPYQETSPSWIVTVALAPNGR